MLSKDIATADATAPLANNPARLQVYRKTVMALRCGVAILAVQPTRVVIKECNQAFVTITQQRDAEVIGRNFDFWLTEPEHREVSQQILGAIATAKKLQICIFGFRHQNHTTWLELELMPVFNEIEQLTHYILFLYPIELTQERLRQEHLYRILAHNLPNGIVLLFDRDYRYTLAAGKGLEANNLKQEDIVGKTLDEVFCPEIVKTFEPTYRVALQGESQNLEYEYKDRLFWIHVVPTHNEWGQICGGMVTAQDITSQKQAENQLRSLAEREKLVAELANRIRESLDLDSVLNTAVSEVRKVLQCDRALLYRFNPDWSGTVVVESHNPGITSILDLEIEDQCFRDNYVQKYQQGRISAIHDVYQQELTPCHREMLATMQVHSNLVVPVLHDNQLWGLLIVHHCTAARTWETSEIELLRQLSVQLAIAIRQAANAEKLQAELKTRSRAEAQLKETLNTLQRTQTQLIQHEKMSSLGQMVAGIAHEINNPISFISGNIAHADEYTTGLLEILALYQQHYPQPHPDIQTAIEDLDYEFISADFPQLLASMKQGTERIRQIVISLRNFSRLDEAEWKSVNLHEGLDNTLAILKSRLYHPNCPVNLVQNYGNLPTVECYPSQLNQAFMNIIENAIDAVETRKKEQADFSPRIEITTYLNQQNPHKPLAVVQIRDNGVGIEPEDLDSIFDPFFTSKPVGQGTGLGLSISYQIIVQQHQGSIDCTSVCNEGTEFAIAIPLLALAQ
ncbi:MAG: GAF domain-containing protein [Jaaginema sp. PMC 1079.18]|nr:GAF domain-containing protein [Jaaginema sp. PMC 1080.18]MEC4852653.1 GAF domain-containing protein [Jaaginema sp. PMC 1079.18]MEC4868190.1 GAF domain-containing protein [Jaaginema sp. PMC 1078.18]